MTTTTNSPVTSQPLISAANTKTSTNSSPLKLSLSQGKKILGKGKNTKPADKGPADQALWLQLQLVLFPISKISFETKAKVTIAMIQELMEELQSMDQESLNEEQESEVTQESDLEQADSEDYLTETEEQ